MNQMENADKEKVRKTVANDSLQFYLAALKKDPDSVYLCARVASCYGRERKFLEAWPYMQKALELGVGDPRVFQLFAHICMNWAEYNKALDMYNKAVALAPEDVFIHLERSKAYRALELHDQEMKEYDFCIKHNPRNTDALAARAKMYSGRHKYREAVRDLKALLKIKPDDGYAHVMLKELNCMMARSDPRQTLLSEDAAKKTPLVTFSQVIGLEHAKRELRRSIIYPLKYRELSNEYRVKGGGGILLYGPPGCGKTFLAKAVAGEAKVHFMNIKITDVLNKYWGNSEKNLHKAFETAREKAPAIMFIDEMDYLGTSRLMTHHSAMRGVVDTFLTEMDGVASQNTDVLVIGATNVPWYVDSALKRSGRFGNQIYVAPPNEAERAELFRAYLKDRPIEEGIDYADLARKATLRTSADIAAICNTATKDAWEATATSGTKRKVGMDMLLGAIASERGCLQEWYEQASQTMNEWDNRRLYPELNADIERYRRENCEKGQSTVCR